MGVQRNARTDETDMKAKLKIAEADRPDDEKTFYESDSFD
jgi:hypothetical protein